MDGEAMKQEDPRVVFARLEAERDKLTGILREWPLKRRLADMSGYAAALREWHESCQHKEAR